MDTHEQNRKDVEALREEIAELRDTEKTTRQAGWIESADIFERILHRLETALADLLRGVKEGAV